MNNERFMQVAPELTKEGTRHVSQNPLIGAEVWRLPGGNEQVDRMWLASMVMRKERKSSW